MASPAWADGPWKLLETPGKTRDPKSHGAIHSANEMSNLHNSLIRGMNCIYLQALHVYKTKDKDDFLKFISFWCGFVHHHHDVEEDMLFPQLEELTSNKGSMKGNIEQHKIFEPRLLELSEYATTTTAAGYDGSKVRSMIDGFGDALHSHLKAEIPTLLALQSASSDSLLKIQKDCEAAGFKQPNDIALPLILGLSDSTFEGGAYVFPAVPGVARYLVHYWYARKYASVWRFLPCDMWGMPRPLQFLS